MNVVRRDNSCCKKTDGECVKGNRRGKAENENEGGVRWRLGMIIDWIEFVF